MKRVIKTDPELHDKVQQGLKKHRNMMFTPEQTDFLRRINEKKAKLDERARRREERTNNEKIN